jgi:hypothetical protein
MITMLLGGLWHGAAWTFVLWGALHGAGQVIERALDGRLGLPVIVRWLITFHVVVLGWILFRSPDLSIAGQMLRQLADPGPATLWSAPVLAAVTLVIGLQLLPTQPISRLRLRVEALRPAPLGVALALVVVLVAATVPSQGVPPFIYFQF